MTAAPKRITLIRPPRAVEFVDWAHLWSFRRLFWQLILRDFSIRYRQAGIGVLWAILQPTALMLVFAVAFGHILRVPSDGQVYVLFFYAGLVAWGVAQRGFGQAALSIVAQSALINKVYFPRLLLPAASVATGLADMAVALMPLLAAAAWYGVAPSAAGLAWLPVHVLILVAATLGVALWLSVLYAIYRDVGHVLPLISQIALFGSPVIYPASVVPEALRGWYYLNPFAAVIDGFRHAFSGGPAPAGIHVVQAAAMALLVLAAGLVFFRSQEWRISDQV